MDRLLLQEHSGSMSWLSIGRVGISRYLIKVALCTLKHRLITSLRADTFRVPRPVDIMRSRTIFTLERSGARPQCKMMEGLLLPFAFITLYFALLSRTLIHLWVRSPLPNLTLKRLEDVYYSGRIGQRVKQQELGILINVVHVKASKEQGV